MPELKMKPTYKIFVLDDDEYLGLHKYIPNVKKEDLDISLGFANPDTKEAYVRRTHCKEMDDETIVHEAEELLAKISPHEEDGIRWKKGRNIIMPILQAVATITGHPYIAAAMGAGYGAYKQKKGEGTLTGTLLGTAAPLVAGALGAGAAGGGAYTAAREAGKGFIASGGQALKAGVGQLLGMTPAAAGTATYPIGTPVGVTNIGGFSQFPGASPTGLATAPLSTTPQTLSIGQSILGSALGAGLSSQLSQTPKAGIAQITPAVTPAVAPAATPATTPFSLKNLITPQNILGAGSLLASQAPKQPEFVMPESVEAIRGKLLTGEGLTPLGQQARMELGTILKSTPQEIYPTGTDIYYTTVLKNLENEYLRQKQVLAQQWNAIDPNYQYNGEYITADDRLNKSYMEVRNNYVAQEEQRRFELGRTTKYQAIQDSLGVDKNVMDDLVGLTGLDVQTAAMIYGAQVQDVQTLRESLGTLGIELLLKGQGIQKQGTVNINLGGQTP